MDVASREIALVRVQIQDNAGEPPTAELLPSPLAEIAAQTVTKRGKGSSPRKRTGSRPRRPQRARRRKPRRSNRRRLSPGEVVVGMLAGINDAGQPLVRHSLDPSGRILVARTTVPVTSQQVDREVVLAFESGNLARPIVLGVLLRPDGQEPSAPRVAPRLSSSRSSGRPWTVSNWSCRPSKRSCSAVARRASRSTAQGKS